MGKYANLQLNILKILLLSYELRSLNSRQRKFFGMSRSELHKLNIKHEKTLKRLRKASYYVDKGKLLTYNL